MEAAAEGLAVITLLIIGGSIALGILVFVMWIVLCSNVGRIRSTLWLAHSEISEIKKIIKEVKKQEGEENKDISL